MRRPAEVSDLLRDAVALARGNAFVLPYPEGAGPEHAFALLELAGRIQEAEAATK